MTRSEAMAAMAPTDPSASPGAIFDRLAQRKLIVVSGKGGVGRTTIAALLGMALAERGRRVWVGTTGHDDRLGWMLGADALPDTVHEVAPGLSISRLVPRVCLREYGAMIVGSQRVASAVFDNRVVRKLLQAIPGLDDFAVFGKAWHEAARGDRFDTVIFDGPATGHLLYTLGVPSAILDAIPTGPLTNEARLMVDTITDPSATEAVLVGLPERWPLTELSELGATLREQRGIATDTIVVNGMWPHAPQLAAPEPALDPDGTIAPAFALADSIGQTAQRHAEIVAQWEASDAARRCGVHSTLTLPWRWEGLCDRAGMQQLLAAIG